MSNPTPSLQTPNPGAAMQNDPSILIDQDGNQRTQFWRAIRRRKRLTFVVGTTIFVAYSAFIVYQRITSPIYSGSFQMLIADPIAPNSGSGDLGGGVVESLARNRTNVDVDTLITTLSSPLVLDPVYKELGEASSTIASLSVTQPILSRRGEAQGVLDVKLLGKNPKQLLRSLDSLSNAFLQFALVQRRERITQGLTFLDQQEPLLVEKLDKLQGKLAEFRTKYNLLSPEEEATGLIGNSKAIEEQLRQVQSERTRLLRLRQDILSGRLSVANFTSTGGEDGVTVTQARSDLLDQLQTVEKELAEARSIYPSDSPGVKNLVALRNRLSSQLRSQQLEAVDTSLDLNATRSGSLNDQIKKIDRQFLKQPALIKDYEERVQRLEVAQANLSSLFNTRATFQLEQAQTTLPWKLISPSRVNNVPVEPNINNGLLTGLLLGVVTGIGAGLLRDKFDRGFHNPNDVKEELGEVLLGHIPHVSFFQGVREENRFLLHELDISSSKSASATSPEGSAPGIVLADFTEKIGPTGYQRFFYQEAFRNLFTSIRFLNSDKPLRTLALTSSLPAEGKSLVNVLLAKTLSEMGQRVLLVDADMRKPQLHFRLGLNNLTGLSNLISELNLHWREVSQKVPGYENWSVITSGTRPPDPTRLLSSMRMRELVHELANTDQFDLVLFDTPPVLGLADAPLLAQHLDGMILLVSLDRVDRSLPKEAISRVRSSGAQLLGLVTNAINEKSEYKTAYGYGNSYKYDYGSSYRHGYGYSVYDPRSSYSYYNQDDNESRADNAEEIKDTTPSTWSKQATMLRRRFLDWIDK
jgi:polysaccharide biosynthesis transport protein